MKVYLVLSNKFIPIISSQDIPSTHQYKFMQMNRSFDQNLNLHGYYCAHPYQTITIDASGDIYSCFCQSWLPISIGKIWDFNSLDEIVDNQKRKQIIESIDDGSYRYCDSVNCNMITGKSLPTVRPNNNKIYNINLCIDESCNLTCPSCRTSFKFIDESDNRYKTRISMIDRIIQIIENYQYPLNFNICGDGDPFASLIYRYFITKLDLKNKEQITLNLMTNGILIKDHWHKISKIHKNIIHTKITFDAGTAQVYAKTRGGNWNKLLESVKFLVQWKKENQSDMLIIGNYVVQAENYFDMKNYVNLCTELGMDAINFQRIENWYTFSDFPSENIFDKNHPKHQDFLTVLRDPVFSSNKINLTNLQTLRDEII